MTEKQWYIYIVVLNAPKSLASVTSLKILLGELSTLISPLVEFTGLGIWFAPLFGIFLDRLLNYAMHVHIKAII